MMTRLPYALAALFALPVLALLVGCTPKEYAVIYTSSEVLNVDRETNQSRPVHVLVYLLKDRKPFDEASDEDLWKGGNDKLKEALVGDVIQFDVEPNVTTPIVKYLHDPKEGLDAEIQHIGIFAQFTTPPGEGKKRKDIVSPEELRVSQGVLFQNNELIIKFKAQN